MSSEPTACDLPRAELGGQLEGYEAPSVKPFDVAAWSGGALSCRLLELPAFVPEFPTASGPCELLTNSINWPSIDIRELTTDWFSAWLSAPTSCA